jgi:hypothetical protein
MMSPQQQNRSYSYRPLSVVRNEIRLLLLKPGGSYDRLSCTLRHVSLDDNPKYTALSYTWGNLDITRPISLDGYCVDVTTNLKSALLHLRAKTQGRTFWIDAVCINQSDLAERSQQVLRMRDIYRKAENVEVWLGPGTPQNHLVMSLVEELGRVPERVDEWLSHGLHNEYTDQFAAIFERQGVNVLKGLDDLFCCSWWKRVWVVQEVSVPTQEKVRVSWGRRTVDWANVLTAAYAVEHCWFMICEKIEQRYPKEAYEGFGNGIRLAQCRKERAIYPSFKLLDLMHQHRDCEASDPRDHIYGLWGLAGDSQELGVLIDYSLPPQCIFRDFVRSVITGTGSMDVLCACQQPRKLEGMPSWVPDWSMPRQVSVLCINERYCGGDTFPGCPSRHFEKYQTTREFRADASFLYDMGVLIVKGFILGQLVSLGNVDAEGLTFEDIDTFGSLDHEGRGSSASALFNQWLDIVQTSRYALSRYPTQNSLLESFSRTLVANRNNKMVRPPSIDENIPLLVQNNEGNRFFPPEILSMTEGGFRSCIQVCYGRRFAITDTGYIGLVPSRCEVADYVCILLGCSLPIVLRKQEDFYELIGECYFHGVTDGELMEQEKNSGINFQEFSIR